ncbi:hypothetical protein [Polaribacter sp. Asnod1-A03]|uniref:hypothetical protein n=1 Tax=Polaribacter sp. Asnod1-A03 TaxID=3160581 RepID=UPI0038676957
MKNSLIILFCSISFALFSQKKVDKKFKTQLKEIEISTIGLDDFVLENSTSGFIEIHLFAENIEEQHIVFIEEYNTVKIEFKIPKFQHEEVVFRKFITERLNRANAIIKIPQNRNITIFGDEINIESNSYKGDLNIFIEKGILKLHKIFSNLEVKMYAGNLYVITEEASINVVSKTGKIMINDTLVEKKYQHKEETEHQKINISSLKANIFLTTQ